MTGKRKIVISDIHGCLKEFRKLTEIIQPQRGRDELIFLGDCIDRGYDSEGTVRELIELNDTLGDDHMIWLLGNHEDQVIRKSKRRLFNRKDASALSKYSRMFSELPLLYETEDCIFVHAGYNGNQNDRECLLEDRSVLNGERVYDGKLYIAGHDPFYKGSTVPFDQPVYFDPEGKMHAVESGMKLPEKGAMFIDTGCVYKNRLTALIIDEQKTVHLESVPFIGEI